MQRGEDRQAAPPQPRRSESGNAIMRELAVRYPELASFTPDATLTEIKMRFGLDNLEAVRELGRRRGLRAARLHRGRHELR